MLFPLPKKWLCQRLKRLFLLFLFLGAIFCVTLMLFWVINSDEMGTLARGAITDNVIAPKAKVKHKGIVQYYPDNQNKHLFEQAGGRPLGFQDMTNKMSSKAQSYETVIKERVVSHVIQEEAYSGNNSVLTYDAHIFYYPWYASKAFDGRYAHWNHSYLPNWDKKDKKKYPTGSHDPENDDIGANFYPQLGSYSSRDAQVISKHMNFIRQSGIGVVVISWYPPGLSDENGFPSDSLIPLLLDKALEANLKLALLVEPYQNMTVSNLRRNLNYVRETYWNHEAFYKKQVGGRSLPVFYLYDSYRIPNSEWQRLFSRKGDLTVRDTPLDAIYLGLLVELRHRNDIKVSKFDGFFTYFAANGFCFGSTWKNWRGLQNFAQKNSLIFVPSLGPGYIDVRIRPWNGQTTRDRRNGAYYAMAWRTLLQINPKMVSITSFNEFHEGTQIEPVIPKQTKDKTFSYLSYEPQTPDFYLKETRRWLIKFLELKN